MVRTFKTVDEYHRAMMKRPSELLRYNVSPGYAVAALGVSRQRVSGMVADEVLDAVKITREAIVLLRKAEIDAYAALRKLVPKPQHNEIGKAWLAMKRTNSVPHGIKRHEDQLLTQFRASITFDGDAPTKDAATSK